MAPLPAAPIAALILDLFGVLVAFDDGLVSDRIAQRCADPAQAAQHLQDLVSTPALITGRLSLAQLHAQLVHTLGLQLPFAAFKALWLAPYAEPMPGMRDLLQQLQGQCRLVLLSNVDPDHWPTVRACLPELAGFHATVLSFEQGIAKPDARSFLQAVAASGVALGRCRFVDDKPANIQAAAAIGLAGHSFHSCSALKQALREGGLQVH